jgi:hypothetical protein
MKYAVEMGSVALIYIPSLIKAGSGIQELIVGEDKQTGWKLHKPTLGRKANNTQWNFGNPNPR